MRVVATSENFLTIILMTYTLSQFYMVTVSIAIETI